MDRRTLIAPLVLLALVASMIPVASHVALAQLATGTAQTVVITPSNFTTAFAVVNGVAYAKFGNQSSSTSVVIEFTPGTYDLATLNAQKIVLNASETSVEIKLEPGAVIEGRGVVLTTTAMILSIVGSGEGTAVRGIEIEASAIAIESVTLDDVFINVTENPSLHNQMLGIVNSFGDFRAYMQPAQTSILLVNGTRSMGVIEYAPATTPETISIGIYNSSLGAVLASRAAANATTSALAVRNSFIREMSFSNIPKSYINSSTINNLYIYSSIGTMLYNDFISYLYLENSNVTLAFTTVNMIRAVNSNVTTYASMINMVSKTNCHCIEKQVMAHEICLEFGMHHWCLAGNISVPPVMHPIFRIINATHAKLCINATLCIEVPIYALNMSKMLLATELGNQSMVVPVMCKMMKLLRGYVVANSNITRIMEKVVNATHAIVNMTLETPANVSLVLPANFTVRAVYKNGTLWHNYTVTVTSNATIVNIGDPTNLTVVLFNTSAVTNTTSPTTSPTVSPPRISTEAAAVIVGVIAVSVIGATVLALRRRGTVARY